MSSGSADETHTENDTVATDARPAQGRIFFEQHPVCTGERTIHAKRRSLSEKEQALICLAASVGAGCRPCTAYHVKSARAAGDCERSILLAVQTALTGRTSATSGMREWAEQCQYLTPEVDPEFRASKRLVTELMLVATAVTVNSAPDLERHVAVAQECGATAQQIRAAIGIARQIQRVAQEKIEAITNRLETGVSPNAADARATACCGSAPAGGPEVVPETTPGCGCR